MTAAVLPVDTLDDLDYAPKCTTHLGCEERAVWVLTVACCDRGALLCDPHLIRWVRCERAAINSHAAACWSCGRHIDTFDGFARWERI